MHTDKKELHVFHHLYEKITDGGKQPFIGWILQYAAQTYTSRAALIFEDNHISYLQLYQKACQVTAYLKAQGIGQQDRVLIFIENIPFFYAAYFGAWQLGAIIAPLNTFLHSKELEHICNDAKPRCIITTADKRILFEEKIGNPFIITQEDITDTAETSSNETISTASDQVAVLLYTSGTTGLPKGVMLSSKNIATNMAQSAARLGFIGHERVFCVLPLFHAFSQLTCVWLGIFMGATIILVSKIDRRLITQNMSHKPTIFLGIPALYGLLCLIRSISFDQVKYFICGADALPDKIRAGFSLIYRRKLCNGYGLTECSPVVAVDLDDQLSYTNTVGKPVVGMHIAIRDDNNNELPQGAIGNLWVKGDNVMLGYYNETEQTNKVLRNNWLNTGDLAYIDNQSKLVIVGREKDIIKHKGINIYPQEIENIILLHPQVIRCAVIGKDDELTGQIPIAFVQLTVKIPNIEQILKNLCTQHLAPYKIPKTFLCETFELPLTATGKVDKKKLKTI